MRITLVSLLVLAACNAPQDTRQVQGQLTNINAQAVFSETPNGARTVAGVGPDGRFFISLPVGTPVTLVVATQKPAGGFTGAQHIGPQWFTVQAGPLLDLGLVHSAGATVTETGATDSDGGTATPPTHMCPGPGDTGQGDADLPYDAQLKVGQTWKLSDAFAEKGPLPAKIVSVTMSGSTWHLSELQTDTAFTVTQADCTHVGNRDVGRDRAFVTWQNADGSVETDHLDLRYCDGSGITSSGGGDSSGGGGGGDDANVGGSDDDSSGQCHSSDDDTCGGVEVEGCGEADRDDCDHEDELTPVDTDAGMTCPGPTPAPAGDGGIN